MDVERAVAALPKGARVLVQGAAGESRLLAAALEAAQRPDIEVVGVFIPGVNRLSYGAASGRSVTTFFLTPEFKGADVNFLPICYSDILRYLRRTPFDAALFMTSPPAADGACSFGAAVDFLADLWPAIPRRIAHLNPAMPRTAGHAGIPYAEISASIVADEPLLELAESEDNIAREAARHVAALIEDGATVQAGVGKLPLACMRALAGKRGLRVHSGMVGDWVMDLLEASALADSPIVTGLALGTERLYAQIGSPHFEFRPVSHTHSTRVMAELERFVTVNAALEVDLFGQVYAEAGSSGLVSGPGGASDFARGAKAAGGTRIIVLRAGEKKSRLVAPGAGAGPISLSRFDVDIIVTEHGAADLRGCSHDQRAERLIAIAAPPHRASLAEAWRAWRNA